MFSTNTIRAFFRESGVVDDDRVSWDFECGDKVRLCTKVVPFIDWLLALISLKKL